MRNKEKNIQKLHLEIPDKSGLGRVFILENSSEKYIKDLEDLQRKVFPYLAQNEILTADIYRKHLEIFPAGQFLIRENEKVIGMSSTMIHDLVETPHTFLEISGNLSISTHDSDADWLYGLDIGIDPEYRGLGLAKQLYLARHQLCVNLGLKGQVTVGMPIGYDKFRNQMTMEMYFQKLLMGEILDPTIGMQQKMGFRLKTLIPNYLSDYQCDNFGVLMIWPL